MALMGATPPTSKWSNRLSVGHLRHGRSLCAPVNETRHLIIHETLTTLIIFQNRRWESIGQRMIDEVREIKEKQSERLEACD